MTHPAQTAVFVFGSNLAGVHGTGAALHAARWCGARRGQGEGIMVGVQNNDLLPACYAIPTQRTPQETLPLHEVAKHIEAFKAYARDYPKLTFQVTRIGCLRGGFNLRGGFTDEQIAPLFDDAPPNCLLPGVWLRRRDPEIVRLILVAPRSIDSKALFFDAISAAAKSLQCRSKFEVVVAEQLGKTDSPASQWAQKSVEPSSIVSFPLEAVRYGQWATLHQNQNRVWYGTHLLAFNERLTSGDHRMIDMAKSAGLQVINVRLPDVEIQHDEQPMSTDMSTDVAIPAPSLQDNSVLPSC